MVNFDDMKDSINDYDHSVYGSARRGDAKLWKAKMESGKADTRVGVRQIEGLRFIDLALSWYNRKVKGTLSSSTQYQYYRCIDGVIGPKLGKINSDQLKHEDIENLINGLKARGLKPKTINRAYTLVNQIIKFGVEENNISFSPLRRTLKVKETRAPFNYYSDAEAKNFRIVVVFDQQAC